MSAKQHGDLKRAIDEAIGVAQDLAEGRLTAADLEAQCLDEHRRTFGRVVGPGDPLWELQLDVCRAVLAAKGIPADELTQWVAVARNAEGDGDE